MWRLTSGSATSPDSKRRLDLLITSKSNTLKTQEQVKADDNEQCALRRDKKKASGLVPIDVDALAGNITAVAKDEGSEGTPTGWTWPEDGRTGAWRLLLREEWN